MAGNSHGHTPAAWTGVIIAFLGSCVAGAFTIMAQPAGVIGGLVVMGLGGVAALVMRAAGLGASPRGAAQN